MTEHILSSIFGIFIHLFSSYTLYILIKVTSSWPYSLYYKIISSRIKTSIPAKMNKNNQNWILKSCSCFSINLFTNITCWSSLSTLFLLSMSVWWIVIVRRASLASAMRWIWWIVTTKASPAAVMMRGRCRNFLIWWWRRSWAGWGRRRGRRCEWRCHCWDALGRRRKRMVRRRRK